MSDPRSPKKVKRVGRKKVLGTVVLGEYARTNASFDGALLRMREVEKLIRHRFGRMLPPCTDADPYLRVIAHSQAAMKRHSVLKEVLQGWCARFAPHLLDDFENVFHCTRLAVDGRRWNLSPSDAGATLKLTFDERAHLDIRTMNAFDVSIEEQRRQVQEKRRADDIERKRMARRQATGRDRESYLKEVSRGEPWKALNISRSYFYQLEKQQRTRSAHPAQDVEWTGSADTTRTGSALTRNIPKVDSFGSAEQPVHTSAEGTLSKVEAPTRGGGKRRPPMPDVPALDDDEAAGSPKLPAAPARADRTREIAS